MITEIFDRGGPMKKLLLYITILLMIPSSVIAIDEFCGCIRKISVNKPTTVTWTHAGADGYELKIIHYFYDGLKTQLIETAEQSYTFSKFPKSSRHFEIQVRAFNKKADGTKKYSIWISSTNKDYAIFNEEACGWLVYTVPGAPSW